MTCPHCRTLNPSGAAQCAVCDALLPAPPPRRQASAYQGVHVLTGAGGAPVRALFDLGANPWVNLLVGAGICLLFAVSALPTVISERGRVPTTLAGVHLVGRDDGVYVRFRVLDADGRSLSAEGTLSVDIYAMRPDWSAGLAPQPTRIGTFDKPVRYGDFHLVTGARPTGDGGLVQIRFLLGESGPFPLAGTPAEAWARAPGAALAATVQLTTSDGRRMGETTPWEDAAQVIAPAPASAR